MFTFSYLWLYLLTIPVFVAGDLLWLGVVAKDFYQSRLAHLLGEVQWQAAIAFYLVFILGILIFAVIPALRLEKVTHALIYGALFGFFAYATYDLTNLATLKNWPVLLTIVDMLWGAVLAGGVATLSYFIGKLLGI